MKTNLRKSTTIIWDFNGTLLDDTQFCVDSINQLLIKRNLPPITVERYRDIFSFPVKNYYEKAGFDFTQHDFHELSKEFIEIYYQGIKSQTTLHQDAKEVLNLFKDQNIKQYILSAMEHDSLVALAKHFEIDHFFENIWGIDDHHAAGKTAIAKKHQIEICATDHLFFIGDTDHDAEVAEVLNAKLIFHVSGHQSKDRLLCFKDALFINKLKDLLKII